MGLKVELKPGERFIVGTSVIRNGDERVRLFVEGDEPILREKDILTSHSADTPAKRIYLAIQLMYLGGDLSTQGVAYFSLAREFLDAVPSAVGLVDRINNDVLSSQLYKALKTAKTLIGYERDLLHHASRGRARLREDGSSNAIAA